MIFDSMMEIHHIMFVNASILLSLQLTQIVILETKWLIKSCAVFIYVKLHFIFAYKGQSETASSLVSVVTSKGKVAYTRPL